MKQFIVSMLFLLGTLSISAQSNESIRTDETVVGKWHKTGQEIKAKRYTFNDRLYDYYVDTALNQILLQLRGTSRNGKWMKNSGPVVLCHLSSMQEKWSKVINYQVTDISLNGDIVLDVSSNNSSWLNSENGNALWISNNQLFKISRKLGVGLGYKIGVFEPYTSKLQGIDLVNGSVLWERKIERDYGWNSTVMLNDTVILAAAGGLHSINLKNGKGWDFDAVTGDKDYSATVGENAAGIVLGVLTGTFVISSGYNLVSDLVSNIYVDSSSIYFASRESIARLNIKGETIWKNVLPSDNTSKSSIFIKDSILYMINYGFGVKDGRMLVYGTPFIAMYNANNGKELYSKKVNQINDPIVNYRMNNDTISLVCQKSCYNFLVSKNMFANEKVYNVDSVGFFSHTISGENIYLKSDSSFKSLASLDSTSKYVYTSNDKIVAIGRDLEIVKVYNNSDVYNYSNRINGYKLLYNNRTFTIIDSKNNEQGTINVTGIVKQVGSNLFDTNGNSLIEINFENTPILSTIH